MQTFERFAAIPEIFRRITNVENSRRAYEENFEIGGLGPLAEAHELGATMLDEPYKIGGVRFIHKTYKLGFAISQEMRDDDQYGLMMRLAAALGRSSRVTVELYGHDVYNNAFTTTKYVGRDGKALVATDHTLVGTGGVAANRPAADVDLSQAALEAALTHFQRITDDRGIPQPEIQPRYLLISPENEMLAARLLQSAGYTGGNLNDINPLQGRLQVIVSPWLTDTDAWFVIAEPSSLGVRFYWREMPDTKTWDDDNADATFHKIRQRHSVGFDDWRGIYGSAGA
jgi:phage major head subunit gpT-like protein